MRIIACAMSGILVVWSWTFVLGETYQWEDDQGGIHFTDNADKVPAKYRTNVRQRESMNADERSTVTPAPHAEPLQEVQQKQRVEELFGGQPLSYWRQRFGVLEREIAAASARLSEKQAALQKAHHAYRVSLGSTQVKNKDSVKSYALNTIGAKRKAYYDLQAEVADEEAKVKELQGQLATLQAEATAAGLPADLR
jgi:Domain of unknown function (DUF4124)